MSAYNTSEVRCFHGAEPDVLEAQVAAYVLTLDSTTHPILAVCPYRDGVMIIAGAYNA